MVKFQYMIQYAASDAVSNMAYAQNVLKTTLMTCQIPLQTLEETACGPNNH